MAVKWSGATGGSRALDVCCGSGDLTFCLAEAVGPTGKVVGLDFAAEMLADAASREARSYGGRRSPITWLQGDALALPFADNEFDAATMGYGLRWVSSTVQVNFSVCD
jgi:demethylphylloquinol methyltransferase